MIIATRLMGGLGNMAFQLAFGESMAKKHGCEVVYANIKENFDHIKRTYPNRTHADEYLKIFPNIDWTKNQDRLSEIKRSVHVPFHYVEIVPEDGVEYIGYFQSYKYSLSEEYLQWLLQQNYDRYYTTQSCSVHVRRSDYLKLSEFHTVLGMDYYEMALDYLQKYHIKNYYVFSDDLPWCKENFKGDMFHFVNSVDYISLWAFSQCRFNVISPSSFSLLGAMLNPCKDKVVISPLKEKWFGPKCKDKPDDILPPYFIQLG